MKSTLIQWSAAGEPSLDMPVLSSGIQARGHAAVASDLVNEISWALVDKRLSAEQLEALRSTVVWLHRVAA